jgi:branched-chain amino acid transport system substrate-binding protein
VAEYQKVMKKAGVGDFNFSSLEGFIAAKVFTEGLKRAGREVTRDKLVRALESINRNNFDAGGFDVNFSPTSHNGSKYVDMTVILKDARFGD